MPIPVSATSSRAHSPSRKTDNLTVPPSGVYFTALSRRFKKTWERLTIYNDYFFRTTDERHGRIVQEILQKIYDRGLIKKGIYEGLYCIGCEKFLTENDLVDGCCPLHPNQKPIQQKEENYWGCLPEKINTNQYQPQSLMLPNLYWKLC